MRPILFFKFLLFGFVLSLGFSASAQDNSKSMSHKDRVERQKKQELMLIEKLSFSPAQELEYQSLLDNRDRSFTAIQKDESLTEKQQAMAAREVAATFHEDFNKMLSVEQRNTLIQTRQAGTSN